MTKSTLSCNWIVIFFCLFLLMVSLLFSVAILQDDKRKTEGLH